MIRIIETKPVELPLGRGVIVTVESDLGSYGDFSEAFDELGTKTAIDAAIAAANGNGIVNPALDSVSAIYPVTAQGQIITQGMTDEKGKVLSLADPKAAVARYRRDIIIVTKPF